MESTHHVLMSERFLRERGVDENTIAHMLLGAAMPDLIQEKIGGSKRAATHFELDETKGGQLHKMDLTKILGAMETAELPYDTPLGDEEDPEHLRARELPPLTPVALKWGLRVLPARYRQDQHPLLFLLHLSQNSHNANPN